jgi:hypothetical protein
MLKFLKIEKKMHRFSLHAQAVLGENKLRQAPWREDRRCLNKELRSCT